MRSRPQRTDPHLSPLRPHTARGFVAADIFGYVCWNLDATGIGQTLPSLLAQVDYLSPMLYPSAFPCGIAQYRNPVAHPYDIVFQSLRRAGAALAPVAAGISRPSV